MLKNIHKKMGKPCRGFTTEEIRDWLEGYFLVNEEGKLALDKRGLPICNLHLKSIIGLVDDEQDGIEAYIERRESILNMGHQNNEKETIKNC